MPKPFEVCQRLLYARPAVFEIIITPQVNDIPAAALFLVRKGA
jgi:hypothetical protein